MSEKQAEKKRLSHTNILGIGFILAFLLTSVFVILDYAMWGVCLGASAVIIAIACAIICAKKKGQ